MADIQPFAGMAQEASLVGLLTETVVRLAELVDILSALSPDVTGRLRVNAEAVANINPVSAVTTVGTVTTVGSVTNQAQIGGLAANQHIIALTQVSEQALRQNITIS
jgi:hypothetical protein